MDQGVVNTGRHSPDDNWTLQRTNGTFEVQGMEARGVKLLSVRNYVKGCYEMFTKC